MFVLGVNISHHPSVCLLDDGEIVYYLEDDRLNRNKEQDWEYNDPMRCLTHVRQYTCLLYTSDAADDMQCVDLGGRRII